MSDYKRMNSVLILIFVFLFNIFPSVADEKTSNFQELERFILIPIKYSDFFCPMCLNFILEINNLVISKNLDESLIIGVVIFDEEKDKNFIKVVEKQIKGFANSNGIRFPVIVDKNGVFKVLDPQTRAIVIDFSKKTIESFKFPSSLEKIKRILTYDDK